MYFFCKCVEVTVIFDQKMRFIIFFYKFTNLRTIRIYIKQGRKRPLDTPKKMIERREREKERER